MRLYELFIGFRYLKSKKNQVSISSNTLLSIFIVFLGVFILIVVNSVMNGFQAAIKDKILDIDSHVTVSKTYNGGTGAGIRHYQRLAKQILAIPEVRSADPIIQGQGIIRFRSFISPVMIRGIGTMQSFPSDVRKFVRQGPKDPGGKAGVYIGEEMARDNNIFLGDRIELIVPKGQLAASTGLVPGIGTFQVLGLFKTGYYDFDTKMVVMPLPLAQNLFEIGDSVWGIGVKIHDVYRMRDVASMIRSTIGFHYMTLTAEERNQNLFYALRLEKLIMTIILLLIIISAGFTIMGTLVMVVMEKRKAVGILKSMGAGPNSIMVIFVLEGFFIGVIGALSGAVVGMATAINLGGIIQWIEDVVNSVAAYVYELFDLGFFYHINIVPRHVYYIEGIPTEVVPEFVVFITVFAVFLCTVAAIFPAWNASRMSPVETIRYE
ncbi:MAG: ABC transporter permease [Spirochaetes bacterium]|nr:ABC transporter permease [Spirochaetota bacterium]